MKFFQGYTVINVKTGLFPDFNGEEYDSYSSWGDKVGAEEVIEELEFIGKKYKNRLARKVKYNLRKNYYQIAKLNVEV